MAIQIVRRPTSGARVFPRPDRSRAMGAADAGIVLIVKRVVWHAVIVDVAPNLPGRPVHDGIDLDQAELSVPLNAASAGPG